MKRALVFGLFALVGVSAGVFVLRPNRARDVTTVLTGMIQGSRPSVGQHDWPPVVGQVYPDWPLTDTSGNPVRLSKFRGKLILVELVGIPCKGCQAFSGGHKYGPFAGISPQLGLKSLEECLRDYGGISADDPRIQIIQILLFDRKARKLPTLEEAHAWETHFRFERKPNAQVLVGHRQMFKKTSRGMIPGFHLVGRDFILRGIAGKPPRDNLYTELLPMVSDLIGG